jgi:hypothetical protein
MVRAVLCTPYTARFDAERSTANQLQTPQRALISKKPARSGGAAMLQRFYPPFPPFLLLPIPRDTTDLPSPPDSSFVPLTATTKP